MQARLPGGISGGAGKNELLAQADAIWKMLDEMSENDPQSYAHFIQQQLAQGKEHFATTTPTLFARIHTRARQTVCRQIFLYFGLFLLIFLILISYFNVISSLFK